MNNEKTSKSFQERLGSLSLDVKEPPSPKFSIIFVTIAIFASEVTLIAILSHFEGLLSPLEESLLDAAILTLIILPMLYLGFYKPLIFHIRKRDEMLMQLVDSEKVVREKEELQNSILASTKDAVIVIDGDSAVVLWNKGAEDIFGYASGEVLGKDLGQFIVPPQFREGHKKGLAAFRGSGQGPLIGTTVEITALRKNGGIVPVELSLSSFQMNGQWHAVGIVRDITERKAMEKALVKQAKLASVGTLSEGVSHEILNPLNIIGTTVQLLQMENQPKEINDSLDTIMAQIKRTVTITNNLRKFAYPAKNESIPLNPHLLLDNALTLLTYSLELEKRNISLTKEYGAGDFMVNANESALEQVFLSIMKNAIDALGGRKDGHIAIRTGIAGDNVEISFLDNGAGIPAAIMDKIFDPFFTTKDPDKGTGLGLSMANSIIEEYGGTITVKSEEGKGAEFTVRLPLGGGQSAVS